MLHTNGSATASVRPGHPRSPAGSGHSSGTPGLRKRSHHFQSGDKSFVWRTSDFIPATAKKRSKAKVRRQRWTSPGVGPQEGEEHTEPYLKLGCSVGKRASWGTHCRGPSYEQECSWRVRIAEEMVLGPRFRKGEGAQRWAQGLLVARGRGLLTLPSLTTPFSFPYPEKHLGACRSAALLTRPCLPQTAGSPGCCSTAEIPPGRALRRGGAPRKEPGVRPVSLCRARRHGKIACNVGGEEDWSLWGEQEIREFQTE